MKKFASFVMPQEIELIKELGMIENDMLIKNLEDNFAERLLIRSLFIEKSIECSDPHNINYTEHIIPDKVTSLLADNGLTKSKAKGKHSFPKTVRKYRSDMCADIFNILGNQERNDLDAMLVIAVNSPFISETYRGLEQRTMLFIRRVSDGYTSCQEIRRGDCFDAMKIIDNVARYNKEAGYGYYVKILGPRKKAKMIERSIAFSEECYSGVYKDAYSKRLKRAYFECTKEQYAHEMERFKHYVARVMRRYSYIPEEMYKGNKFPSYVIKEDNKRKVVTTKLENIDKYYTVFKEEKHIRIFTDGSFNADQRHDGGVGVGACAGISNTGHFFTFDIPGAKSSYVSEFAAIYTAVKMVRSDNSRVTIYSDCLNAVELVNDILDGKKLKMKKLHNIAHEVAEMIADKRKDGCKISLAWVKGHNQSELNIVADYLAGASRFGSSRNDDLKNLINSKLNNIGGINCKLTNLNKGEVLQRNVLYKLNSFDLIG